MAQYGMLRDYRFTEAAEDIRGSKLYGLNDEKLGKIDDVIFDHCHRTDSLRCGRYRRLAVDQEIYRSGRAPASSSRTQGRLLPSI